jgi:predicted AlkP superfamily phosphohydrolase/phosphomutase
MKLLVVGLDGCSDRVWWDHEVPAPFIKQELIPHALYGTSISHVQMNREGRTDPHTGPNWASIYTGVSPDKHGIDYGGWMCDHKSHGSLFVKSIWYMIREQYKLALIGMPVTYPAFDCEWMISGFPNSSITKNSVYPKHLYQGLANSNFVVDYGDGHTLWRDKLYYGWKKGEGDKFIQIEFDKFELAKKLYATDPVDVLAFGITSIDKACHIFTMFSKQVDFVYKKVDKLIRKMVEHWKPEKVVIVSDHGFQAVIGRHNERGFYLVYDPEEKTFPRQEEIQIDVITGLILDTLDVSHYEIGKTVVPEEFEQEEKEAIENRYRNLGYLK